MIGETSASAEFEFQPIPVQAGGIDEVGVLMLVSGRLLAVFVRLDDEIHERLRGRWHLEAAFGPLLGAVAEPFGNLDEARRWVVDRIADRSPSVQPG